MIPVGDREQHLVRFRAQFGSVAFRVLRRGPWAAGKYLARGVGQDGETLGHR